MWAAFINRDRYGVDSRLLGLACFMLVVAALYPPVALYYCAKEYTFMYNTLSEVALEPSWWQQMDAFLQLVPLKDLPWYDVWPAAVLKVVVWVIRALDRSLRGQGTSSRRVSDPEELPSRSSLELR